MSNYVRYVHAFMYVSKIIVNYVRRYIEKMNKHTIPIYVITVHFYVFYERYSLKMMWNPILHGIFVQ